MRCILAALIGALFLGVLPADGQQPVQAERQTSFGVGLTGSAEGTVLAVTKDSILITMEKGPPATFPFHDFLAAGKVHKQVRPATSYLASDVRVGDFVDLDTIVENKQTFCVAINIWERPGGSIPAGQVIAKKETYHEVRNADIAFRDKGTPVPEHLKPTFPALPPPPDKVKK